MFPGYIVQFNTLILGSLAKDRSGLYVLLVAILLPELTADGLGCHLMMPLPVASRPLLGERNLDARNCLKSSVQVNGVAKEERAWQVTDGRWLLSVTDGSWRGSGDGRWLLSVTEGDDGSSRGNGDGRDGAVVIPASG